ncbi:hypothetical protein BGZ63DRAFT_263956 [Mariannaea sp. PMI_226]|nr:hypothetical protein BGZ63DRAFT_263956 [Mariannaea sp. PMI_226]
MVPSAGDDDSAVSEYEAVEARTSGYRNAKVATKSNKSNLAYALRAFSKALSQPQESEWTEDSSISEAASASIDMSNGGAPIVGSSVATPVPSGPRLERQATRTIQFTGLPPGVTHQDIVKVVRGGKLVEVYLSHRYRNGSVSFVYGEDAKAFFARSRHSDLYIKGQKVNLKWSDRQFALTDYIAGKIKSGASRTIVIRNCESNLSEAMIRADLDHIHNLVVIKVEFFDKSCFIQTNSVSKAMMARTCLSSRLRYRGYRLQWGPDECDRPLAEIRPLAEHALAERPPAKPNNYPMTSFLTRPNRFEMLRLGDKDTSGTSGNSDSDSDSRDSDDTLQ